MMTSSHNFFLGVVQEWMLTSPGGFVLADMPVGQRLECKERQNETKQELTKAQANRIIGKLVRELGTEFPTLRWASNTLNSRYFPKGHRGRKIGMISCGPRAWRGKYGDLEGSILHEFAHHYQWELWRRAGEADPTVTNVPDYVRRMRRREGPHGKTFLKALVAVVRRYYGDGAEWMFAWHLDYKTLWQHAWRHGWSKLPYGDDIFDRDIHEAWLASRNSAAAEGRAANNG